MFTGKEIAHLVLIPSSFTYENKQWLISDGNRLIFSKDKFYIDNLYLSRDNQKIHIFGVASDNMSDSLTITFSDLDIDNFAQFLSEYETAETSGKISGKAELKNILSNPFFTGDITIKGLKHNKKQWGDLLVNCEYNHNEQVLFTDIKLQNVFSTGTFEPVSLQGHYYLHNGENNLDYKLKISAFDLRLLEPFLQEYVKIYEGRASGEIDIKGNIKNPKVSGDLWFMRTIANVKYLNTIFVLKDTVHISENKIFANDFILTDARGKTAKAYIQIDHSLFNDFNFDITVKAEEDFIFMNTQQADNDDFYGTVAAKGVVHIMGKPEDISVNISAITGQGTQFFLPVTSSGTVYESDFITFKGREETAAEKIKPLTEEEINASFELNLNLEITPEAEMQIIFDPKIGDIMKGKAKGNLQIHYNMDDDFVMFGEVELMEGDYLFTLQNIISKKFFLHPGGTIKWEGDPYDAILDIKTYYPLRTRLYELVCHIDSSDIFRKRILVHVELALKNNLLTPDIAFNIELPVSDENTKNIMKTAITSDQELNRQVFALLVMNSFLQPEVSFAAPISRSMGTTSTEFISHQFSNWLSQISKDFDIGVKYRPGSEITTEEIEVMLSTQLFNDRIRIEGNVGMGGNQIQQDANATQQVLGDVVIENKLTKDGRVNLKAFNKSNQFDAISNNNSPYTQGVGVFFRRDFDTLKDLFPSGRKGKNKNKIGK